MAIRLDGVSKDFLRSGRSRRPLYRELLNIRALRTAAKSVLRDNVFLEVFLFDEFLMSVDESFCRRVEDALTHFPSERQIVLHASHDHELMRRTCTDAIYVDGGGVRRFGSIAEVLELHLNA
jgi:ABC-type Na+ transport system ATPase subunit NatA